MPRGPINPIPLTVIAAGGLVWAAIGVTVAAIGPEHLLPQLLHSRHTEHFLAFYGIGVLSTAGLPGVRLKWIFLALVAAGTVFGLIRFLVIDHTQSAALEDWLAEIAGASAALIPILIGMHRQSFRAWVGDDGQRPPD